MRVGIELGKIHCSVARVNKDGDIHLFPNMNGENRTPVAICFEEDGTIACGESAKYANLLDPSITEIGFADKLSDPSFETNHYGKTYKAEDLVALLLKDIISDAEMDLGEKIDEAVITVPVSSDWQYQNALIRAAEKAGLKISGLINEPIAIALAYSRGGEADNKTIVVYNLGERFDVSVIKKNPGQDRISVIASSGDDELGGQDWDKEIMSYLEKEFREQTGFEGEFEEDDAIQFEQDLRLLSEKYKKQLTTIKSVKIPVTAVGMRVRVELSREKFEELTEVLLLRTINHVHEVISKAESKGEIIDEIIMTGNASRMPQVMMALTREFPHIAVKLYDPEMAVVRGAAIYSSLYSLL